MDIKGFSVDQLLQMAHSKIDNYIIAGLSSSLIGEARSDGENGCVRLFENNRNQQQSITPHSHRFDFQCVVLRGEVCNRIFTNERSSESDDYIRSKLIYKNEVGKHEVVREAVFKYVARDSFYKEGECYSMGYSQIHSIFFSKGAKVLFFEGKKRTNQSVILEPYIDGEVIPTYKVESWMFVKN